MTREQFLDMWAGLVDYTTQKKQLPSVVEELVKLGFELYATEGAPGSPVAIQPSAFDQLFQKMNLGRPYAVMAYKVLSKVRESDVAFVLIFTGSLERIGAVGCRSGRGPRALGDHLVR